MGGTAVYRLPAVKKKNMALSTQRIHGLIPVSDLSLTQLYPACLLRTHSLRLVFLNDFPVIVSTPLCLCQCVRLYCNGVPVVDRYRLCSLFPIDRSERKGETPD